MALGETQIVAETKQFLIDNGIHLEVFNEVLLQFDYIILFSFFLYVLVTVWFLLQAPTQRSKTVILVKNLDAQSNADEIRELFSAHGEVGRVLLPPRGVTAIVEFLEPTEAKSAFRKLAYSKFRHMPLYLEWAPVNVFRSSSSKNPARVSKKDESVDKLDGINLF